MRKILIFLVLALLTGCQEQRVRGGILPESVLEDVLYDYQLAIALAADESQNGHRSESEYRYVQAVFDKHNITSDEFDLSLAHYTRNPKQMLRITKHVSERMTAEVQRLSETQNGGSGNLKGDTVTIWQNEAGVLLTANGQNHFEHHVSGKEIGACRTLFFKAVPTWYSRENDICMALVAVVKFDNDSTAVFNNVIREYNRNNGLSVSVPEKRKVREVTLQAYPLTTWKKEAQVTVLTNMALQKIKQK